MQLDALRTFAKVAELASFTQAAQHLGLTKARVSTLVQGLEGQLGTRLLHRTTRTVRLTPDGEQFLERCRALLAEADDLAALFHRSPDALRGRLRVDLPTHVARSLLIPRLPAFMAAHPLLEIELSTSDRRVDVVHEGFDCVLRIGTLSDSGLVARRLGSLRMVNCASPAYLREHGTPHTLGDLAQHRLIHYTQTLGTPPAGWEYLDEGQTCFHPMRGSVTVNGTDAYQASCLAGLGLIQVPVLGLESLFSQGLLVEVMPDFVPAPMPVSLLYPNRRNLPQRMQVFMAWLRAVLVPQLDSTAPATGPG
jgi:DNA-binding transcriptional LysR family regulator